MNRTLLGWTGIVMALAVTGCGGGAKRAGGGPPPGMAMNVKAEAARVEAVEETVALVASLSANEAIEVSSEIAGTISAIHFEEGQAVEAGHVLFELDASKLAATVAEAESAFSLAQLNRRRAEDMLAKSTISQQEFDQALATHQSAEAALTRVRQLREDAAIKAPFEGLVGARYVSLGQVVNPGAKLATLSDVHPMKAEFHVPERFAGQLTAGMKVALRVTAYPDAAFEGTVYFIDPILDPANRTVLVKATIPNEDRRLRPGMFGNLNLILSVKERAVTVPESAINFNGDQPFVFTMTPEGTAQIQPVQTGLRVGGRTEITGGLSGGELVIFEGTQKIGPGSPVKNTLAPSGETSATP